MSAFATTNLLDEALDLVGGGAASASARVSFPRRRFVLVEDCVETSGVLVLHHLLKRVLSSPLEAGGDVALFVALAQPFSHYDRVLRKLGCNLAKQRDSNRLFFFDMLKLECPGGEGNNVSEVGLVDLYAKIRRAVEIICSSEYNKSSITIMIDDISLLEIAAHDSGDHVLDFLHYCITLTSELDCSLVVLIHEDIYSSTDALRLLQHLEYLADIVIKTKPLPTGSSTDVHGQLTVLNKGLTNEYGHSWKKVSNFQFRVKENSVDYFYPGRQA